MAKVKVAEIKVLHERFREDYGNIEELAVSIQRYGLFHPIIVQKSTMELVAGERRFKAHQMLKLEEVEVRFLEDVDDLTKREIEIEENLRRKDFTWQEEVKAKSEVNRIKREKYGAAIPGHGGGWGLKDTAQSLGESIGLTSRDVRLAAALEEFPELMKEQSKDKAWKKFEKMKERGVVEALADKVIVRVEKSCLKNGDSTVEMRLLAPESVDLVLTDPPFAIALDKGGMKHGADRWGDKVYDDEYQHVMNTIELVLKECYRVLKNDRHAYVFFGTQHMQFVHDMLVKIGFHVPDVPSIWHKTGGGGQGGGDSSYASNYESFFHCSKGHRALTKAGASNVFVYPRVAPQRKLHPTEKPTAFIRDLIEQSSVPGELVIDPFAGSASTLIAAFECKRQAFGIELDKEYFGNGLLRIERFGKSEVVKVEETI